jgi:hydroxymethylbilane synthase
VLRVATRGSALARWQASRVIELLGNPEHEFVIITTTGDARTDAPIHQLGGQGVFVKEVQQAVLERRADLAVHSAKDLPALTPRGLVIGAIPERADPRDALVGARLADLAPGAIVGTGAVRRRAQLRVARPDLQFGELRGNVDTRITKAAQFDAVVIAVAALQRLERVDVIAEALSVEVMLPQVGQGALAVECRADDDSVVSLLATIDNPRLHTEIGAERAFLARLGGGCDLPVGAFAETDHGGRMTLRVFLETADGARRAEVRGTDPYSLGRAAFEAIQVGATDIGATGVGP